MSMNGCLIEKLFRIHIVNKMVPCKELVCFIELCHGIDSNQELLDA